MSAIQVCDFTVVIDSNESAPYQFQGLMKNGQPLIVQTIQQPLWALGRRDVNIKGENHSVGFADYTIQGMEEQVSIERKSISDLFATLGSRRRRFEAEIKRLHEDCEFSAVVVEGDYGSILTYSDHGPTPNSVIGTITAWSQRYCRCHWILTPSRAAAERLTFRHLERFWNDRKGDK